MNEKTHILKGIPFKIKYEYSSHKGSDNKIRKYPKVISIVFVSTSMYGTKEWDMTELIDHNIVEQIKNDIFKELNKDIYPS